MAESTIKTLQNMLAKKTARIQYLKEALAKAEHEGESLEFRIWKKTTKRK